MTLQLHATPEEVMRAVEALQEFALGEGLPEKTIHHLALALEECASNIVNHALKRDPTKEFRVTVQRQGERLLIELRDPGPEFDPTAVSGPISPPRDNLPGGWGINIVLRYTDGMTYRRNGGENILLLIKNLSDSNP